jgi:hypothetical protein
MKQSKEGFARKIRGGGVGGSKRYLLHPVIVDVRTDQGVEDR